MKYIKTILTYPKYFGSTGWYMDRVMMRDPFIYHLSFDLKKENIGLIGNFKRRINVINGNPLFTKMAGKVVKILSRSGFTSEPYVEIDAKSIIEKIGQDIDIFIHVDGAGCPHIKNLTKLKCPTVLWALDTHIKLKYLLKISPDYDYVFVAQKRDLDKFKEVNSYTFWLPYASDITICKPSENVNFLYNISFVGNIIPGLHEERMRLLKNLTKVDVHIFKNKWLNDMVNIYNKSKIIFNKSINGDLNMRVFEAMSCGRLLLTDRANGILDIFSDKKHLIVYNENNLEELILYYLDNSEEREKIAKSGYNEVVEKHTYEKRLEKILKISLN